jgi:16S rRNA (guanine966-N2)-methyltransferase
MARRHSRPGKKSRPGRLRIVAGKWRSRLLAVADDPILRPTSERIRETLFNWLSPKLAGASCLDLFAGSGALGLEALSRGAGSAVFVERSAATVQILQQNIAGLEAANAMVLQMDSLDYLRDSTPQAFDLVFLDPPFAADLYVELCRLLQVNGWLAADARIYLEQPGNAAEAQLPDGWDILKDRTAGNVRYFLLKAP